MKTSLVEAKRIAGRAALEAYVRDGMCLGLGSGSTVELMLFELAKKIQEGLHITAVSTSKRTEEQARKLAIPVVPLDACEVIDVCIDGADEIVLADLSMIKGGGGFLLWEKIIARLAKKTVIIADQSKCVDKLGAFPLPVEIIQFGKKHILSMICETLNVQEASLRQTSKEEYFITDSGNLIVDIACHHRLDSPTSMEQMLNALPGVVENGLFCGLVDDVFVGCIREATPYVLQRDEALSVFSKAASTA